MSGHRSAAKERRRFGFLVAHFVDHMDGHLREIREQRDLAPADAVLDAALERALRDMAAARASLAGVLDRLGDDDGHSHGHRHADGGHHRDGEN